MRNRAGPELVELIGEEAMVRLAEAFGGTRLYVPLKISAAHEIARAVGLEAAQRLVDRLAPDRVKVPLAHELRARHYRAASLSNREIARRLGVTESGIEKIFRRERISANDKLPERSRRDDRQPTLFD